MNPREHAVLFALGAVVFWSGSTFAADCTNPGADWLFCDDFEGSDTQDGNLGKWDEQGLSPSNSILSTDPARVHGGARSLEITAHKGADTGGGPTKWFLPGVDTVYVRYWLQFSANYNYPHHMVFIGASEASNQWAAFGMAGCRPSGSNFFAVSVDLFSQGNHPPPGAFGLYSYSVDMQCDPGANCTNYADPQAICDECASKGSPCNAGPECCWGANNLSTPAAVSPLEQWVCVEAKISANTGGQPNGAQTLWIDDQEVGDWNGTLFRTDDALKINSLGLWHYVTDDSYAPGETEQTVWFDDVAISTTRIGCGDVVPSTGGGGGTSTGGSSGATAGGSGPGGTSSGGANPGWGSNGGSTAARAGEDDGGCGCRTRGSSPQNGALFLTLFAIAGAFLRGWRAES